MAGGWNEAGSYANRVVATSDGSTFSSLPNLPANAFQGMIKLCAM